MTIAEFDQAFPITPQPNLDGIATHLARVALGLPTAPVTREQMLVVIGYAIDKHDHRWDFESVAALLGACAVGLAEWDLCMRALGRRKLGTAIKRREVYADDPAGLVHHVATAVRLRVPAPHVAPAMTAMRDRFMAGAFAPDPRFAAILAGVFVRELVVPDDPIAATRAWLDGAELEIDHAAAAPIAAVADGEDPRAKIFERYAGELDGDFAPAPKLDPGAEVWSRGFESERGPLDDLAIHALISRRAPFERWTELVDPAVAHWLGAPWSRVVARRLSDQDQQARGAKLHQTPGWYECARALAVGKHDSVLVATGRDMTKFEPGRFFKDDGRKLVRYLATAMAQGGTADDVTPAWHDFLSRRSPATTPNIEGGVLTWRDLLGIQAAITHAVGKQPRESVGLALRLAVSGVA